MSAFIMFYREFCGKNDICSFRAMTVALTVSFKLVSFYHLYHLSAVMQVCACNTGAETSKSTVVKRCLNGRN